MDKLAADNASARESGLTYGQWKILHPDKPKAAEQKEEGDAVCQWCGKLFWRLSKKNKYCCDMCRTRGYARSKDAYYQEHKEHYSKLGKEYRDNHKQSIAEYNRAYAAIGKKG